MKKHLPESEPVLLTDDQERIIKRVVEYLESRSSNPQKAKAIIMHPASSIPQKLATEAWDRFAKKSKIQFLWSFYK